jgi:hypothetical protein
MCLIRFFAYEVSLLRSSGFGLMRVSINILLLRSEGVES